jgi:thioredoxin reductase (NADPH)
VRVHTLLGLNVGESIPIFACLEETDRQRFAARAADVRLQPGEWLIREGEVPYFFVLLEGTVVVVKDILGRSQDVFEYKPGTFFGEVPILMGAPSFAGVKAKDDGKARVARFDAQQLFELVQTSAACSALILQTMTDRMMRVQRFATEVPTSRVLLIGTQYDKDCREIRQFLSANRIPYEWVDAEKEASRMPVCMNGEYDGPTVVVDNHYCVETPTVRRVAEALGIRTQPRFEDYDVVVVGAGPAGLAAGVYGASEGLKVLVVERSAAGGQAGTSSRIENYLGFPNGISGEDLSDRALKQAGRFGAEISMTRTVEHIEPLGDGRYCVELDGGQRVSACVVLIATGVEWRRLEAEGVGRFQGRGVLYGASRNEASNVVGKRVVIVGGGIRRDRRRYSLPTTRRRWWCWCGVRGWN